MAKRTSFEQTNNNIHPTRKKIIDTVFGRDDDNKKVHGYNGEAGSSREIGDIWTDKDGHQWEQKDGYTISVTKMDAVRKYLDQMGNCTGKECDSIQYSNADKKLIRKTGMCINCLAKYETNLKADGTYPYYEDYKITRNKLAYVRELKQRFEEALEGVKSQFQIVNEDGSLQNWTWETDIDEVKQNLKNDIDGAYDAIEALLERKGALEEKLIELNHPELIKK
jgi:hypothetical protein